MLTIRYIYCIPSKVFAVCVLKWSIFTNSIKNTALNKRDYFLVRHGGRKKISQVYGLYNSKNMFLKSQHSTPLTIRSTLTIDRTNRSCKKTCSCKTSFSQSVQKLFSSNIKSIGFSNPQNFLQKQIPVKKVVLITIKTKYILRIIFNKNFLVKFLHIELKISPKRDTVKLRI